MVQEKTPGVYIVEKDAFPNSVVAVETAAPAFLGYTQRAQRGSRPLTNVPTRITSLPEFEALFGGAPDTTFSQGAAGAPVHPAPDSHFLLYHSLRLFFDNGGSTCWIVSVGPYRLNGGFTPKSGADFDLGLALLEKEPEPTILVAPDAVLLAEAQWADLCAKLLAQCQETQSRVAILDVYDGDLPRAADPASDVITRFRNAIDTNGRSFGMAYYPWVNAAVVGVDDIDFRALDADFAGRLAAEIAAELDTPNRSPEDAETHKTWIAALTIVPEKVEDIRQADQGLRSLSATYCNAMEAVRKAANVLPPAAGIAGVYARIDEQVGVFKAPANTELASVISPTVTISDAQQEDLNLPFSGKAVNAIRSFVERGVLVWGARTLDGNSQDWRYVSVRRTLIYLEQSIKLATEPYGFAPNTANTWATLKTMLSGFLHNEWKAGALVGATPEEAYRVDVGPGATMTLQDLHDGYMNVTVYVAVTRPAEFIVITYQQKMQTS